MIDLISLNYVAEIADENSDPLYILLNHEAEEAYMSTETKKFNMGNWLKMVDVVSDVEVKKQAVLKPDWLVLKPGVSFTPENSFAITAAIVKHSREIVNDLTRIARMIEQAEEAIAQQEARAYSEVGGDRHEGKGFNPDGTEYLESLQEAHDALVGLKLTQANGEAMLYDVFNFIEDDDVKASFGFSVEVGRTTRTSKIGIVDSVPRMEPLTRDTLPLAIASQNAYIKSQRR